MPNLKALMLEKRLTLAVAESVTCGHLQARIGAISGASSFFLGGVTAYTLEQKIRHLGVPRELAEPVDCVSEAVAVAMVQGARRLFGAAIAAATTGYAEPSPAAPTPHAWIAIASADRTTTLHIEYPALSRVEAQRHIAQTAYDTLVEFLAASV